MSGRSTMSSGSAGLPAAADIIDLDRYMRAAVRPGLSPKHDRRFTMEMEPHQQAVHLMVNEYRRSWTHTISRDSRERLVVDPGLMCRKAPHCLASGGSGSATPTMTVSDTGSLPHIKRFSHDSGLSDGTNPRYRQHSHRLVSGEATHRCRESARARGSTASLLAFRAACERALREQQEQIARVAQLCERLGERQNERCADRRGERRNERAKPGRLKPERTKGERVKAERTKPKRPKPESTTSSVETSDITSSSHSARERRKDKHRSDECKTYKIIMSKLDELSLLFAARRPMPPVALGAKQPPPLARVCSSGSVSVSDKIVATDPDLHAYRHMSPTVQILLTPRPTERAVGQVQTKTTGTTPISGGEENARAQCSNRTEGNLADRPLGVRRRLAVTRAHFLEISPLLDKRPNITTERVVQRDFLSSVDPMSDRLTSYDLEDPVHLYAQAKRLESLHMKARRARSEDRVLHSRRLEAFGGQMGPRGSYATGPRGLVGPEEDSLCERCRNYWRAFRECFINQLFCRPGRTCAL